MPERPTQKEYWNSQVGAEWANHADRIDAMLQPMTEAAFDILALQPGERVLDIGCGAGATTLKAARRIGGDGLAVGVDLSRALLDRGRERARATAARTQFVEADAGVTTVPGGPFDAAFSRFGVMFFDEPAAAFANIRRMLKPGGRLVFVCWRPFAENLWSSAPLAALSPLLRTPLQPPDPNAPGPFALADASKTRSILEASGWRDISIAPWDGAILMGGDAQEAAGILLKIGPCARVIAEQNLDAEAAAKLLVAFLTPYQGPGGVARPAACWIVRALA